MRLLLIRHGQTPANVRGEIATARPGPGLTPLGLQQAASLPGALSEERIDGIYVSPLRRTAETAAPLSRALGIEPRIVEGLEEIEAGDLEDASDLPSIKAYVRTVFSWTLGKLDARLPGSIDGHEFFGRFDGAIASIAKAHPDGTAAVVSHGAAIRVWAGTRAKNIDTTGMRDRHLDNTGVVVLTGSPEAGWWAESWEGEPIGGERFDDPTSRDPLGDPRDDIEPQIDRAAEGR